MRPPQRGEIWIDPSRPAELDRQDETPRARGYSAGQGDGPPMGAIVGIGIVAVAGALLLGKLGAS